MDILLMLPGFVLSLILTVVYERELRNAQNKVHFYIVRDKNGVLSLYLGKPVRKYNEFRGDLTRGSIYLTNYNFNKFGLNKNDYAKLKWEDGPVEVFLNLED